MDDLSGRPSRVQQDSHDTADLHHLYRHEEQEASRVQRPQAGHFSPDRRTASACPVRGVYSLDIPLRIPNRDVNPREDCRSLFGGNYFPFVVILEAEIIVGLACIRIYGAPFLMLARTLPMTVLFLRSGTVAKRT